MSQTAVHRAVSDLEHMIGGQLVERRGRVMWLNPAGGGWRGVPAWPWPKSSRPWPIWDSTAGASRSHSVPPAVPVPISCPRRHGAHGAKHPRAGFKVLEGSWRELVEPLRDGEIDMIVGALRPFEIADLYQMPLYEDRLVIAAGSQHPLARVEQPTLEQLAAYRWIVPPANSPLREQWEQLFEGTTRRKRRSNAAR
jgi:DNA-binding transcriptional LysR family regulator